MRYAVLGPLQAYTDDGQQVPLGGPQRRVLLLALLVEAGRTVPTGELIDAIWGHTEPPGALATLRTHISELRRHLGAETLAKIGNGYVLRVERGQLDEHTAAELLTEGRQALAAGDPAAAQERLAAALALWRGQPLADAADRDFAGPRRTRLLELELDLHKCRVDAELARHHHRDVLGDLRSLVATHPHDEGLRRRLALALHLDERPTEAAEVCRAGLAALHELGLDSRELSRLQQDILRGEVTVPGLPEPRATPPPRSEPEPADQIRLPPASQGVSRLPPDVGDFTGRATTRARLVEVLTGSEAVAAVSGKAGVGKTALAIRVAHELAPHFPDGALYVDLRGTRPQPLETHRVLSRFLNALGLERSTLPTDHDELAELYRDRLAGQRVLVVLDNAFDEAQVRPLLPRTAGCGAIVTSRSRLSGLDAAQLTANVLHQDTAVELLARTAGRDRVAAEPESAARIAELCGHLPLAVLIAGRKLAARPFWRLEKLAARLSDEHARLSELAVGDLEVRASFALSYDERSEDERRAFRLLGLLDTTDVAPWVAGALLDLDPDEADDVVESLADAQLLERRGEDATGLARFRFHDLLRVYARELLAAQETAEDRAAALARAVAAYLVHTRAAAAVFSPGEDPLLAPTAPLPWRADPAAVERVVAEPLTWYGVERLNLHSVVAQAAASGLDEMTWLLAGGLIDFLEISANRQDWRRVHEHALDAARRAGDRIAEAVMLCNLGRREVVLALDGSGWRLDTDPAGGPVPRRHFTQAEAHFTRAGRLFEEAGHELGAARAGAGRADALDGLGRPAEALALYERAVRSFQQLGQPLSEGRALTRLGVCFGGLRRFDEAVGCLDQAQAIIRDAGHRWLLTSVLRELADIRREQQRYDAALACYDECIPLLHALPDPLWEARLRSRRADLLRLTGDPGAATRQWERALALLEALGSPEAAVVRGRLAAPAGSSDPLPAGTRRWPRLPVERVIDGVAGSHRLVRFSVTWTNLLLEPWDERFLPALEQCLANGARAQILLVDPDSDGAEQRNKDLRGIVDVPAVIRENLSRLRVLRAALPEQLRVRLGVRIQSALPVGMYYRWDSTALMTTLSPHQETTTRPHQEVAADSELARYHEQQLDDLWVPEASIGLDDYDGLHVRVDSRTLPAQTHVVPYVRVGTTRYAADDRLSERLRDDDVVSVSVLGAARDASTPRRSTRVFPLPHDPPEVRLAFERKYGRAAVGEVVCLSPERS